MCDPVSLTLTAGVFSAMGSLQSGMMASQAAAVNAQALEQQAQLRTAKGEYDAEQAQNKFRRQFGQGVAGAAASGISLASFGDVFADMTMESALEQKSIRWGAAHEADNLRLQEQGQRINGEGALVGGIFGAAGNLIGAAAKANQTPGKGFGSVGFNALT